MKMMYQYYFSLLLIVLLTGAYGSASNRRYSAYEYDMTTPQYTPDGQLLQVQYATNACIREGSNPIVSVGINSIPSRSGGDDNNCKADTADTILIMATISSPPPSKSSTSLSIPTSQKESTKDKQVEQQQSDEDEINLLMHEINQRTQNRIIEVSISKSSTILVGLTGILSDASYLLQKVYSQLEEEQQTFGWHRLGLSPVGIREISDLQSTSSPSKRFQSMSTQPSETVMRISRAIADECQKYTFGGGQRPFGASLMLGSVDDIHVTMCETHPNGGWKSQVSNEKKNDGSMSLPQIMISGGPIKSQHRLKSLLTSRLRGVYQITFGVSTSSSGKDNTSESQTKDDDEDEESLFLRRTLQTVISSLVEEWKDRDNHMSSSHATSVTDRQHQLLPQMEVVVSSNKRGTFRLTEKDLVQLIVKN